ncbi:MAG: hypothetical protein RH859_12905 [Longimicrobiales bacterium]
MSGGRSMRRALGAAVVLLAVPGGVAAQADTTMAQEGVYDRPFITGLGATSVGGYLEGNTNWFQEDGVGEGFSMELRRFNLFLFSAISPRVRFLAELEFEHGTEEIALETALVDLRVRPSLVLRAGILLPPIGYLNQNHDSPRWDFIERPLVTTEIIPSTLSEVGGGVYGKVPVGGGVVSYDVYLTNGLGDGVVENGAGRTHIPAGKREEQFAEDNNGSPAVSARLAVRRPGLGEVGASWYGGTYNTFRLEGVEVDDRRRVDLFALDAGASLGPVEVRGEAAWARIDVPPGLAELFGERQWGGHLDLVVPVWRPRLPGYADATVSAGFRVEHVDFNTGTFTSTGGPIGDQVSAVVPGVAFRPTEETVFRLNYRYSWHTDFVGNAAARSAGWQLGFATYF